MAKIINEQGKYKYITPNELRLHKLNSWKDWRCSVGFNALHIDLAGKVWGGTCREGGLLGNIYDKDFNIKDFDEWIICTKNFCGCTADIRLPKVKNESYKHLLEENTYDNDINNNHVALNWESDLVHISWDLGKRCNYECSYCPPYLHDKHSKHLEVDKVFKVLNIIRNKYKNRQLEFSFSGGEPTLHPDFIDICKYINDINAGCIITTNGSRSLKYLESLLPYLKLMIISHHFEFLNKEKMAKKVDSLVNNSETKFILRLMMKPGEVKNIINYHDKNYLKHKEKQNVFFEFTPIRKQKPLREEMIEYDDLELNLIQEIQKV